jgi:CRP/FNR family cyclic AMP-dependent transcriptional regulator
VPLRSARDYKQLLRTGRWFGALEEALQDALLAPASLRALAAGERLFARGDAPSGLFAIVDGTIRISGVADDGKEALLTLLDSPAWFGEISLFDRQPRTHDAVAESEALVVQVPQAALDALLAAEPRYWHGFGLLVTSKLRLAFTAMEDMALLPIAVRLARRLALMAEGYGERAQHGRRTVEVSQDLLAMMLSTSRQTANQLLKDLEARRLVRLSYGAIEILNLDGLRAAGRLE